MNIKPLPSFGKKKVTALPVPFSPKPPDLAIIRLFAEF